MDSVQFNGYFDTIVLCTDIEDWERKWIRRGVELWRFWLFHLVDLLRFGLACICNITRSPTGMACIVPVFALGTWVACFSSTKAFRSAVILILVRWLFAFALAWRPAWSARTKGRTALRIELVYRSGGCLRECSDVFLGDLGAERLFESFVEVVFFG